MYDSYKLYRFHLFIFISSPRGDILKELMQFHKIVFKIFNRSVIRYIGDEFSLGDP